MWLARKGGDPRLRSRKRGRTWRWLPGFVFVALALAIGAVVLMRREEAPPTAIASAAPEAPTPAADAGEPTPSNEAVVASAAIDAAGPSPTAPAPEPVVETITYNAAETCLALSTRTIRHRAGLVREPREDEELPTIRLGAALWSCDLADDDPSAAPTLDFALTLGEQTAALDEGGIRLEEPTASDAAAGPAPAEGRVSLAAGPSNRDFVVTLALQPLAALFDAQTLTLASTTVRSHEGILLESVSAVASEGDTYRVAFPAAPNRTTLGRTVWLDLHFTDEAGSSYTLTLQTGPQARRLLVDVLAPSA